MKHVYFYIFIGGWIFFYWCWRRGSKLSSIFCRCFKFYFKRVPQNCFKGVFFNNFSFVDWPFRICLCPFVDRFTSLIEMILVFMKKGDFECSETDLLSVSILSDLMLLVIRVRKRAVHKECLVLGIKFIVRELDPKKMGIGYGGRTKHNIDF